MLSDDIRKTVVIDDKLDIDLTEHIHRMNKREKRGSGRKVSFCSFAKAALQEKLARDGMVSA